eukprot:2082905-Rhodomonas_salina.2
MNTVPAGRKADSAIKHAAAAPLLRIPLQPAPAPLLASVPLLLQPLPSSSTMSAPILPLGLRGTSFGRERGVEVRHWVRGSNDGHLAQSVVEDLVQLLLLRFRLRQRCPALLLPQHTTTTHSRHSPLEHSSAHHHPVGHQARPRCQLCYIVLRWARKCASAVRVSTFSCIACTG